MRIPSKCPSCGGELTVVRLKCRSCESLIEGDFTTCPVCKLDGDDRELFDLFMDARGNLKEVQRELGVSYPTARNRMEGMFSKYERLAASRKSPMEILKMLRQGEIGVDEAEKLMKRGE